MVYYEKHLELFLKVYESQKNNLGDGSGLGSLLLAAERKKKSTWSGHLSKSNTLEFAVNI